MSHGFDRTATCSLCRKEWNEAESHCSAKKCESAEYEVTLGFTTKHSVAFLRGKKPSETEKKQK